MLEQTAQVLSASRVILASGSPRRREIIERLGIDAEIVPSRYEESLARCGYETHGEYVQELARYKVEEVYDRLKNDTVPPSLIIGADTVVTLDGVIYGKPKSKSHAFETLSRLANREHVVYTGVCLRTSKREINFYESTKVKFGDVSEEQIRAYVETGEPMDKAGGYGVQGLGACLIEKVNGDFYTVMGMPLYSMVKQLNALFARD